ncbi:MAG TPA: adenylate/guanylate cyclase domain-containing protein [Kofleriaceae bacterium]|jgi:class 3 adenylate cyclase|nr:adenylate/guanylate cyclase domain-containing protein [Kofleriaceae bacterium]
MFRRLAGSPGVQRLFGRLIRIGRAPEMLPSEARYVVLSNIIAMLGVAFTLGFAPILVFSGSLVFPALQVAYALGYLPVLWLNHRGHHTAAATYLVLSSHLLAISQVLVAGTELDVHLFFMLHTMLPFLVFAPRHDKLMFTLSALAGIDLVLVVALGHRLPHLGPVIPPERLRLIRPILLGGLFATLAACAHYARRATLIAEAALDRAHQRSEELLLNILPPSIARRLKLSGGTIADGFADVSVLFADIVGFTRMASQRPPEHIVGLLNDLFCKFDDVAGRLGLEKIKTIGDCYMVAGGLPEPRADHAEAVAEMALAMLDIVAELAARTGDALTVRIGIHSGPVIAGVIGKRKFIYDLWGDTVNVASRMESHGLPGAIQISEAAARQLDGKYRLRPRGVIEIKGKGAMETWLLEGHREIAAAADAAASAAAAG